MPARKILVVDDDDVLRDSLVEQLSLYEEFEHATRRRRRQGHPERARAAMSTWWCMDVGLPDMDGREAVKLLRKGGFKAPVIMLTGQDSESDTILGLEAGANDYVTKPFRFAVLLARIRAQLRQHEQSEDAVFTIGRYTFRPGAKMLVDERGQKIRLTEKETAILKFLYRAGEKVITRDVLLHEVWGYNSGVTTHTLETHIYRLRQKIEKDPSQGGAPGHRGRRLQAGPVTRGAGILSLHGEIGDNRHMVGGARPVARSRRERASKLPHRRAPASSRCDRDGGRGSTPASHDCDSSTR